MEHRTVSTSPFPFSGEDWFDPLEEAVRFQVHAFIEAMVEEEVQGAFGGRKRYQRKDKPKGYRNRQPRVWPIVVAAFALVFSFSATTGTPAKAGEKFVKPEGVTILSPDEFRAKIVGNTMTGTDHGGWTEYYLPDGKIRGISRGYRHTGTWEIDGGLYCADYWGTDYDGCWTLSINGDQVIWYKKNGKVDGPPSTLLVGNPKKL